MPSPIRDNFSGAIVFHPTPEEQDVKVLRSELQVMKDEMAEKLALLDEALKTTKKRR